MTEFKSSIAEEFLKKKKKEAKLLEERIRKGNQESLDEYISLCARIREEDGVDLRDKGLISKARKLYGVLFGDDNTLKYFDPENRTTHSLKKDSDNIYAIFVDGEEVYYGKISGKVHSLFGKFTSSKRDYSINAIQKHKERIIDSGGYGLYDTLEDKVLISEKEINFNCINSLSVDEKGNLFGILGNKNKKDFFMEIKEDDGIYHLGDIILNYDRSHNSIDQNQIIPWGKLKGMNGRTYPFSTISCANHNYLDLNGEKIAWTESAEKIYRLEQISLEGNVLEVIYAGELKQIIKAKIDLKRREVVSKEIMIDGLGTYNCALEPVRSYTLHQKLIKKA